jgi:choline dehydrogenase
VNGTTRRLPTSISRASTSQFVLRDFPLSLTTAARTIAACENIGLPYIDDINSPAHPPFGCGRLHFTRDNNAHRNSTYHAFLPKELALRRKNLHICTGTIVEKLDVDSRRNVRGVYLSDGRSTRVVRAVKEVVLSAGPFASPQILMLR